MRTSAASHKRSCFHRRPRISAEPTHVNVCPPIVWIELFAAQGFGPDLLADGTFLTPHTMIFRKGYPCDPTSLRTYALISRYRIMSAERFEALDAERKNAALAKAAYEQGEAQHAAEIDAVREALRDVETRAAQATQAHAESPRRSKPACKPRPGEPSSSAAGRRSSPIPGRDPGTANRRDAALPGRGTRAATVTRRYPSFALMALDASDSARAQTRSNCRQSIQAPRSYWQVAPGDSKLWVAFSQSRCLARPRLCTIRGCRSPRGLGLSNAEQASMLDYRSRISIDPDKRGGKPCIRGLRITVYDVLEYLASGMSVEDLLNDFPDSSAMTFWRH